MHRLTQHTDDPAEQVPLDLREDQVVQEERLPCGYYRNLGSREP